MQQEIILPNKTFFFNTKTLTISESKILTEEQIKKENKKDYLRNLNLILNNSCNLKCQYCYANQGKYNLPGQIMTFETAIKGINLVINSVQANHGQYMKIGFFGGEPLLSINLIIKIVEYIKKLNLKFKTYYLITTNGTLLNKEIIDFFSKNQFNITISLDGDEKINDKIRKFNNNKGTYNTIINHLPNLKQRINPQARITISNHNYDSIHNCINHLQEIGFKKITFDIDNQLNKNQYKKIKKSLSLFFKKYFQDILKKNYYEITNISSIIIQIALQEMKKTPCKAGLTFLSLSAEGKIHQCHRFTGDKNFEKGNINSNSKQINKDIKNYSKNLIGDASKRNIKCALCPYVFLCGGLCYHSAQKINNSPYSTINKECMIKKFIYYETLKLICKLTTLQRKEYILNLIKNWKNE